MSMYLKIVFKCVTRCSWFK